MEQQSKEYTINIKDCRDYILSKWKIILVFMIIFMALAGGVAAFHYVRQTKAVNELQQQMEEDYVINAEQYEINYARATETLADMEHRVAEQDTYIYDSIYLGLDERNVLVTSIDLYLIMDANDYTRKSYLSLCADGIMTKTDWEALAAQCDSQPSYIEELVKVEPDYDHGLIKLRVLYPEEAFAGKILDTILGNLKNICKEYSFLGDAEFNYVNRAVTHEVDEELAEQKKEELKIYNEYLAQLEEGRVQVDAFYAPKYPTFKSDFWKGAVKKSILLVLAAAFAAGFAVSAVFYLKYVKNGLVYGASEYRRLTGIEMLGCLDGSADVVTYRNIAIKLANSGKQMVLLQGNQPIATLDQYKAELKKQLEALGVTSIEFMSSNMSTDNDYIAKLYYADSVVFVAKRLDTTLKDMLVWQEHVQDAGKQILGNIIL